MLIKHTISPFLKKLFPNLEKLDNQGIIDFFKSFYTVHGIVPEVTLTNDVVVVQLDPRMINQNKSEFNKAVRLYQNGDVNNAKKILSELVINNPNYSEYYRLLGQIESEQNNPDKAIDYLIEALRMDSSNSYALLMMGNVFAKQKEDIETALVYYNQALETNPDDFITLTNIGYALVLEKKFEEAEQYLNQATKANPEYGNAWLSLAVLHGQQRAYFESIKNALHALKCSETKDEVHKKAMELAQSSALNCIKEDFIADQIIRDYMEHLTVFGEMPIKMVHDESISTIAKIEFAENYDTDHHVIKFKDNQPAYQHLIMHELVHLDFVIEARKAKMNQLFVADGSNKNNFIKSFNAEFHAMKGMGYSEEQINLFTQSIFDGLNLQVYNTPIDLFIEQKLFNEHPKLRPFQFLSLLNIIKQGIEGSTNELIVKVSPKKVVNASKILNLVQALQFKALFGVDLLREFKPTKLQLNQSTAFYNEFLEYVNDKEPAEEYELITHWAEDLKVDGFSELVSELEYRKNRSSVENFIKAANDNTLFNQDEDAFKARLHKKFLESAEAKGADMTVVMYMVQAMNYFDNMSQDKIKATAYEIALLGAEGIKPNKEGYQVKSIPQKSFTGLQLMAYYYVSWALAIPEMLKQLGLPYDEEYTLALKIFK